MPSLAQTVVLYDDRIDLGLAQLEKIVQSLVWLGDVIVLPPTVRMQPGLPPDVAAVVSHHVAEFAEAGFVEVWDLETQEQLRLPTWMPSSTTLNVIPESAHIGLAATVDEATVTYRRDILRGVGKGPDDGIEGITEFVALRSAVWAEGLAHLLQADHLLQLPQRSAALPLRKVATVRRSLPVVHELMRLQRIRSLALVDAADLRRLRRRIPGARDFVDRIVASSAPDLTYQDEAALVADVVQEASAAYMDIVMPRRDARLRNIATSWTVNLLGLINPVFSVLGFAQPLVDWGLRERRSQQIVTFMAELRAIAEDRPPL